MATMLVIFLDAYDLLTDQLLMQTPVRAQPYCTTLLRRRWRRLKEYVPTTSPLVAER